MSPIAERKCKIYNSTEHIEAPEVGDLKLSVNSMWDFKSRSVCFEEINNSFGGSSEIVSYDLNECIESKDGIIIGGTRRVKSTKWVQAEITAEIIRQLELNGYSVAKKFLEARAL